MEHQMNFIQEIYLKLKSKFMNSIANDVSKSVDSDTQGNSSNLTNITDKTTITQQSAVSKNEQDNKDEEGSINDQDSKNEQDNKNEQGSINEKDNINEQDLENINIRHTEMINTRIHVTSVDFNIPNDIRESNFNISPVKNLDEDAMKKLKEFEDILNSNLRVPNNTDYDLEDINDIVDDLYEHGDTKLLKIEINTTGCISTDIKTKLSGNNIEYNVTSDFLKQLNNNCDTVIQLDANIPQSIMNDMTLECSDFTGLKEINNDITKHEESASTKPAEKLLDERSDGNTNLETSYNLVNRDYSLKAYDNTTEMTTSNDVSVLNSITELDDITSLPVKTDIDTISISSTDTKSAGFNSSDFEFITQSEAEMDGLITNFNYQNEPNISDHREGPSSNNNLFDKSYRTNHEIPEGDSYLNLFQGMYDPWLQEIHFYENKCIHTSPMNVEYAGLGFNLQFDQRLADSSDEEFIDEAKATVRKIISNYPHVNRKRRRKH